MNAARVSLRADHVSIEYQSFTDVQAGLAARLRREGNATLRRRSRVVKAVNDVSFDLHEGQSIGIVGHNGAGKSTLLLGLGGLLEVSGGQVLASSRPTLLGIGAALTSTLSGRRNIETGCLALGMSQAEVDDKIESIIDFTGLREFIDMPMKTYSTGMRARLNFTVATVSSPPILLIDEALAVGDQDFRTRAVERLEAIRANAGSVVLVSHNLREMNKMCDKGVWLDHGEVVDIGPMNAILKRYKASKAGLGERPVDRVVNPPDSA